MAHPEDASPRCGDRLVGASALVSPGLSPGPRSQGTVLVTIPPSLWGPAIHLLNHGRSGPCP